MTHKHPNTRFSIGELVEVAYEEAGRLTGNRRLAAILASKILETLLETSNHPELIRQLQGAKS